MADPLDLATGNIPIPPPVPPPDPAPQPTDWKQFAGTGDDQVDPKELSQKPESTTKDVVVTPQADGSTRVTAAPDAPPVDYRGLVATPRVIDGRRMVVPAEPYTVQTASQEADRHHTAITMAWNGNNDMPWKQAGNFLTFSPPQQMNGQTGMGAIRQFVAELSRHGIQPTDVKVQHGVLQHSSEDHPQPSELAYIKFGSGKDLKDAHAVLSARSSEIIPGVGTLPVQVHVSKHEDVPAGMKQVWETHFTDSAGNYGVVLSPDQKPGASPVFVPESQDLGDGTSEHSFQKGNQGLLLDGQVRVVQTPNLKAPLAASGFWGAHVDGRVPDTAVMVVGQDMPQVAYGASDPNLFGDPTNTVVLKRTNRNVEVQLPGEQVSVALAHKVENVLRRTGVTSNIIFSSQTTQ